MKKDVDAKYPHSATLFQFCRRVLDHKFGGIRVIDQDVGQILGYDPADCSHWKKGKKNIRSIHAIKSIADHLGVDEKLIIDVASGEMNEHEAFHEYNGYGTFSVDVNILEDAKKDFFRRNASQWSKDKDEQFRSLAEPNVQLIHQIVNSIHERINFAEAPLYLPEVVATFPELRLISETKPDNGQNQIVRSVSHEGKTSIFYVAGTEMKPFTRYRLAQCIGGHFLGLKRNFDPVFEEHCSDLINHLRNTESTIFAAMLLCPESLIRKEIGSINVAKDIVTQLSEVFWVSKTFMNRWLRQILAV